MSIAYRKVKVASRSNGSFRQSGLLVMNQSGNIWYATNASNIDLGSVGGTLPLEEFSIPADCGIRKANGLLPNTSFDTIVRLINNGDLFPFFESCVLSLDGSAVECGRGALINVNAILGVPAAETAQPGTVAAAAQAPASDTSLMNGLLIKPAYAQDIVYHGFGSYHGHAERGHFNRILNADKPWRIGVELEVYARSSSAYNEIINSRSNWFQCERDGSLRESSLGIEMKTIPLRACDAKSVDFWNEPMARLKTLAKSKGCSTTGLHVHIGKEILGTTEEERQKTLAKLNLFYVYHVEDIAENHRRNVIICGRERGYSGELSYAKSETADNLKRFGVLDKINEDGQKAIGQELRNKCGGQRWDINIGNYNSYGTIEFRKADGSISKTRLAAVVTWWEQMVLYCKETPWNELNFEAFFRKVTSENPCVAYFFNTDEEA